MTEFLEVEGGRIAYEVAGEGPLVVLAARHGRSTVTPTVSWSAVLAAAGYRVANAGPARARGVQHRLALLHPRPTPRPTCSR